MLAVIAEDRDVERGQKVWKEQQDGSRWDIKNLSPLQASTLLLRNTLVILKGEP